MFFRCRYFQTSQTSGPRPPRRSELPTPDRDSGFLMRQVLWTQTRTSVASDAVRWLLGKARGLRPGFPRALDTCSFLPAARCGEAASGGEARPQRLRSRSPKAARETSSSLPPGTGKKHPLQIRPRGTAQSETLG